MRIIGAGPGSLTVRVVAGDDGIFRIASLYIEESGSPLTVDRLRQYPLGRIERILNLPDNRRKINQYMHWPGLNPEAGLKHMRKLPEPDQTYDELLSDLGVSDSYRSLMDPKILGQQAILRKDQLDDQPPNDADEPAPRRMRRLKMPARAPYPRSFFRDIARAYRAATAESKSPGRYIADEAGVTITVAYSWIQQARRHGYLGRSRSGQVGEGAMLSIRYVGPMSEAVLPNGAVVKKGAATDLSIEEALSYLDQEDQWLPVNQR